MSPPEWNDSQNAWFATVECPLAGRIWMMIQTNGVRSPPTDRQVDALRQIEALDLSLAGRIETAARHYAAEYLDENRLNELSDADYRLNFSEGLIPPLRNAPDLYYFLAAHTEIDLEHGVACLFRNGDAFRVCHTDLMYESYDWDDMDLFEDYLQVG